MVGDSGLKNTKSKVLSGDTLLSDAESEVQGHDDHEARESTQSASSGRSRGQELMQRLSSTVGFVLLPPLRFFFVNDPDSIAGSVFNRAEFVAEVLETGGEEYHGPGFALTDLLKASFQSVKENFRPSAIKEKISRFLKPKEEDPIEKLLRKHVRGQKEPYTEPFSILQAPFSLNFWSAPLSLYGASLGPVSLYPVGFLASTFVVPFVLYNYLSLPSGAVLKVSEGLVSNLLLTSDDVLLQLHYSDARDLEPDPCVRLQEVHTVARPIEKSVDHLV